MKNWDHSIHQHVQKFKCTKLELFCFIFGEVIKKFMGSVFWVTMYIYIYIYIYSERERVRREIERSIPSVMVTVVGTEHGDPSSNPGRGYLHFT